MKNKNILTILVGGMMSFIGCVGLAAACLPNVVISSIIASIPRQITLGAPILEYGSAINLLMEGGSFSFNHAWGWEVFIVISSLLIYAGTMMILGVFRNDVNVRDIFTLRYWTFVSLVKTRKQKQKRVSKLLKK